MIRRYSWLLGAAGLLSLLSPAWAALLVSSNGSGSVERFDLATGSWLGSFVPAGSGGLISPDGMAFGPDGNLYVSNERASSVLRYDGRTGASLGTFVPSGSGGMDIAEVPTFGPDGNLYVSSTHAHTVLRYCTQHLEDFMVPKTVEFIDSMPKTMSGKILKRELAQAAHGVCA